MKWVAFFVVAQVFFVVSCEESKDAAKAAEPAKNVEAAAEAKKDEVEAEAKKEEMAAEAKAKFQNLVQDTKRAKRWGHYTTGYSRDYYDYTSSPYCKYEGCRCYSNSQCYSNYCRNRQCRYRMSTSSTPEPYTDSGYRTTRCSQYGCYCWSDYQCDSNNCLNNNCRYSYQTTRVPEYEYATTSCKYYGCYCTSNYNCNSYNCEWNRCRHARTTPGSYMTDTWAPTRRNVGKEEWNDEMEEKKKREEAQENAEEWKKDGKKKAQ